MPEVLAIEGLSHAYGSSPILNDVSLSVSQGELVSVLGRSGAGKTTLLRAVGGFVTPSAGVIRINGRQVNADGRLLIPTEDRHLGIVFQDYALFGHMSVAANVGFGVPRADRARRVAEMLDLVGLSELADRGPAQLSGGQQQRVALARALAPDPALLLLDEPFANLDAALRGQLRDDLRQTLRGTQTAALLITHDRAEALSIADRTVVLVPGPHGATVAQCAAPRACYQRPSSEEVAMLTGQATIVNGTGRGMSCETGLGTFALQAAANGELRVLIRPEQLVFQPAADGPAVVRSRQFLGATVGLMLAVGTQSVRVVTPCGEAPEVGQRGHLVSVTALHAFS